jgi:hypothetical protein
MAGVTNLAGKFWISTSAENADLDQSGFDALGYVQVPNLGTHGDTGMDQNVVSYSTWDKTVLQKGKGEANAGDPDVEFLDVTSAGMTAMEAAAVVTVTDSYAFKVEWADGSLEYNRGVVTGPRRPKGANEDFKRVIFKLGLQQAPVLVAAP